MENKKPRLDDPAEFALIRSIYFEKDLPRNEDIDPIEKLERMYSRERNLNSSSR